MKLVAMAGLVAAQLSVAAQPAAAAELIDERGAAMQRQGAFAGARLRVPLGGQAGEKARAGLTMAPVRQASRSDGSVQTRFGEGVELNLAGAGKPQLALGGRAIAQGPVGPDGRRLGTSTGRGLLIVGGIVVLTLGAVALLIVSQE